MNIIETNNLILREQTLEDTESLHTILSNPITMSFWDSPLTLEATQKWIQRNLDHYSNSGFGRYAVILKSTQELIAGSRNTCFRCHRMKTGAGTFSGSNGRERGLPANRTRVSVT